MPASSPPVAQNHLIATGRTQLLVSVRTPQEALDALAGGAGILDIKEPSGGPLGMVSLADLYLICATARAVSPVAISAALGEVLDWQHDPLPPLAPHLQYAKLGLAGLATERHWRVLWEQLRREFDVLRGKPLDWVAVAYADAERANAPAVREVLEAAIEGDCRAFLIDTFDKTSGRLVDLIPETELRSIADHAHAHQLAVAFAGRVGMTDLPRLLPCEPDVIAVRGAACESGLREGMVSQAAVAALIREIGHLRTPAVRAMG
jgi:(5-formylfuran-3-yl)methyl phosphate synthase